MAVRLFNLRHVPEDEANDVRALLSDHGIDFYETHSGGWGVSMPAIWLHDDARLEEAKLLIADYQQQRAARMRAEYERLKSEGRLPTLWDRMRQYPVQFLFLALMIVFVLYVTLSPFLHFGE